MNSIDPQAVDVIGLSISFVTCVAPVTPSINRCMRPGIEQPPFTVLKQQCKTDPGNFHILKFNKILIELKLCVLVFIRRPITTGCWTEA